jgi:heme/copper-type cytochrome/quinol oxidase subunit 4
VKKLFKNNSFVLLFTGALVSSIGTTLYGFAVAIPFSMIISGAIVRRYNVATLGIFCVIVMLFPLFGFLTNKKVKTLLDGFGDNETRELQETV